MPQKDPQFISKSLENPDEPAKIIKPRKRAVRPKAAPRSKPSFFGKKETKKEKLINSQLTSIYSDGNGHIPNMKQIVIRRHHPLVKIFFFLILLGAGLAAAAWSGFFVLPEKKFAEEKVTLAVQGPTDVMLGATTTFTIKYRNAQNSTLKNAVLSAQFPKGFVFSASLPPASNLGHSEWNLGDIGRDEAKEISITGLLFGQPGQEQSWRVFLTYRPENMNSDLQKIAIHNVSIEASHLSLVITGPAKAVAGNQAEYRFQISKDEGEWPANKLELKPVLPENFHLASSSPVLDKNKTWLIKNPTATSTLTFKLTGKYSSSTSKALIKGALTLVAKENGQSYELAGASASTAVEDNDINFNLAINGTASDFNSQPGELLNITLHLKNMTKMEMKNASVKLILDAPASKGKSILDWTEITDELDGNILGKQINENVRRGEIVWNKEKLPALAKLKPTDSASIDLRVPIKDGQEFNLSELKAYEIKAAAELTYLDSNNKTQTISGNPITTKLNSDLKLEVRDTLINAAGDKETHKVIWMLSNSFHPLKNLYLSADIYGSVDWQASNASTTPAGQLEYDPKLQRISWTVPEMPLDVDVLALPFIFSINQKNTTQKVLVSKVHVQAIDTVSGEALDFLGDEIGLNP